jgi:copper chaperone NosL
MKAGKRIYILSLLLFVSFFTAACNADQTDQVSERQVKMERVEDGINYGVDLCEFEKKPIEVVRYGGRIEMENGVMFNFMSVECLAGFYLNYKDRNGIKSIKAVDFAHGEKLLPVSEMKFLHSTLRPSPNGMFLTAVDASNERMLTYIYDAYPGPYLEWDEVLELVRNEWDLTGQQAHNTMN